VNGNYVLRVRRVGFELVSQTRNMRIDRASVERSVFAPNVMEQLFARNSLAGMGNQELQEFKFPRTEIEGLAFLRRPEAPQIKGYVADRDNFRPGLLMLGAPQHRFDAGQELAGPRTLNSRIYYIDPAMLTSFANPAPGTLGSLPHGALIGSRFFRADFSALKRTRLTEHQNIEFRAEFFNVFNTVNFENPNLNINDPNFGVITAIRAEPRVIQFALRYNF
jgi:hypothetical protein